MDFLKRYGMAFLIFLLIDFLWLAKVAPKLYKSKIGHLMAENENFVAAGVFYVLFIAALVFFVISPAIDKRSVLYALGAGAFFGLATYGTYDLTNLATLKNWSISITVIDLIWGSFLCGSTSALVTKIFIK